MQQESIEQKIREVLAKKLGVEPAQIKDDTRLAEDLGLDSFGGVEIMFEIEEAFGLKIDDADFQQVRTFSDVVAYVTKWKAAQARTLG